ncbi:hypothetical protein US8_00944 [Bacillus altitudinis]|nr:hypothetical protein US8_00944 [Bacillus altitudinis]
MGNVKYLFDQPAISFTIVPQKILTSYPIILSKSHVYKKPST